MARLAIASREGGDFIAVLFVGIITDPLMYLWFFLAAHGLEEDPLRVKCPHCTNMWTNVDQFLTSPIGHRWTCNHCKNVFVKTPPPQ